MRAVLFALAGWVLVGFTHSADAEPLSVLENEYEPLVSTKQGRVESCGYGFNSILRTVNGRIFFVTGSANTSFPTRRLPLALIKIRAYQIVQNKPIPQKVNFAMLRHGNQNTLKMRSAPGEDGYSILYGANINDDPFYMMLSEHFSEGLWVSFNITPGGSDFVFRLPAMSSQKEMKTVEEVAQCQLLGLDAAAKDLTP